MISFDEKNDSGTTEFHKAMVLCAPNAVLPDVLPESAEFGVLLHPIEMNACRVDFSGIARSNVFFFWFW